MHPKSLFACRDETRSAEVRKMPGNLGLGDIDYVNEVAHAGFTGAEEVEDAQTRAIGKRPEQEIDFICGRRCHIRLYEYRSQLYRNQVTAIRLRAPSPWSRRGIR